MSLTDPETISRNLAEFQAERMRRLRRVELAMCGAIAAAVLVPILCTLLPAILAHPR